VHRLFKKKRSKIDTPILIQDRYSFEAFAKIKK